MTKHETEYIDKKTQINTGVYLPPTVFNYKIDPYDLTVLICLLRYRNKDSDFSFPSTQTIVFDTNISKSRVFKSLSSLEAAGIIKIKNCFMKKDGMKGRQTSNRYYFPFLQRDFKSDGCVSDTSSVRDKD